MRSALVLVLFFISTSLAVSESRSPDLVLKGARIYRSPAEPSIEVGTVVMHDGRIAAVGPVSEIQVPRGANVIDCKGLTITAGFWNSHVHILLPGLLHAEKVSSDQITSQLREMLTRWGFTTVFDIASTLQNTNAIRNRIKSGEAEGPHILTVGEPFWVKAPVYVEAFLEANQINIPAPKSPSDARERVVQEVKNGADGIKIFANSIESKEILAMPLPLAQAITAEAHHAGKPVFAHVSDLPGIEVAVGSNVDILAHTTIAPWDTSLLSRLVAAHMALTPTLTLWDVEFRKGHAPQQDIDKQLKHAANQLGAFHRAGGQVLFGTDVGYIDQFDTSEEFDWMARSGMTFQDILASLTVNPAQRFGYGAHSGQIATGLDADLVVLGADPAQKISAFSQVRYTIRSGRVIYREK
jgi:imidazolonepropionase-like amidohydrolase